MTKFLTGNELNSELEKIFVNARTQLILISPYIKLHQRFLSALLTRKNNARLKIIVVFGKNDSDFSKSMKQDVFNFFKEFPNIEIRYENGLHAKYYANEATAIITSMNLYDFSQDNNIEAGVKTKATLLNNLWSKILIKTTGVDNFNSSASTYFTRVIEQSQILYENKPNFKKNTFWIIPDKYTNSTVLTDKLTSFFENNLNQETKKKGNKQENKPIHKINTYKGGYCIRTGVKILFNINKPMSYESYKSWLIISDPNNKEYFCHFSGEPSNGATSISMPILKKHWIVAKKTFNF